MAFAAAIPAIVTALASSGLSLFGAHKEKKREKRQLKRYGPNGVAPGEEKRFERFTPEQQQVFQMITNLLTGQGEQPTEGLLGEVYGDNFDAYAEPALRTFNERIAPGIAERYTALGAGSQRSSAFQNRLAEEGSNLSRDLAESYAQRRQGQATDLINTSLTPQYHTQYEPRGESGSARAFGTLGQSGMEAAFKMLEEGINNYYKNRKVQGSNIDKYGRVTGDYYG
jgi:hypothetical protein